MLSQLERYAQAIRNLESRGSGGYSALGPLTKKGDRAYGAYQVMGDNIPSWTKDVIGQALTPDQFLANRDVQDAVFRAQFGKNVEKYGNPYDAASVWFTGRPMGSASGASADILGTTGNKYVNNFRKELGVPMPSAPANKGATQMLPMMPKQEPKSFLQMLGLQKQIEGAQGEDGQKFYQRDTTKNNALNLASALNSLRLNPDAGLDARVAATQGQRKQAATNNATAKFLEAQGRTDLANAILSGAMTGQEAYQALRQEKIATTAFDRNMKRDQAGYDNSTALTRLRAGLSLQGQKTMAELNDKIGDGNAEVKAKQSEDLLRLKFELQALADTELTAAQQADVDAALKRIEIQQGMLEVSQASEARLNTASEVNNEQTKAETEALQIGNEGDQMALDALKNPPDDVASDITFDSFDIKQAAAGDIGGVFKGIGNKVAGALGTGPVSPAQTAAVKQMDTINQVLRGPLAKELSSMGGKYALQLAEDILPKRGDNDFEMAEKIKNLVTQTLPAAEAAARAVLADTGSTKTERTRANGVLAKVPAITKALEASLAGSGYGEQTSQAQQEADAYLSGQLPAGVTPEDAAVANATAPSSIGAADDLID
jgi:hypothetical protein